jgi:SARP family transcriptional regulator, regulator of embCAB operon
MSRQRCGYVGRTLAACRIQLCGSLAVRVAGRRVEAALPGRQGPLLLAHLVLHRGRDAGRDELVDALWPDEPPAAPDASLRVLVSRLRAALGEELVPRRGGVRLVLPPDAWVDVEAADEAIHRAESAVGRGAWRDGWPAAHVALNVSRRPFLAGHDDVAWVRERRRHLEHVRLRALSCWAAIGLGIGGTELADAERAARLLVEEAPYREDGHRLLMEVLAARGNRAEALQVYEALRRRLRDELGTAPGEDLRALHARLLA